MGIEQALFVKGFTPAVRKLMAHPNLRTDAQKKRFAARTAYRSRLRRQSKTPPLGRLLRGHSVPKSAYLRKLIPRAQKDFGLVVTSTNDGKHAAHSNHYKSLAVDFGVTGDIAGTPEHTRRLKKFQLAMFIEAPHLLELYGPIRDHGVRGGRPLFIEEGLWKDHLNHVHVASSE